MIKEVHLPNYHRVFDSITGKTIRWGITPEDDPEYSPLGPEIADIEISVNGCPTIGNSARSCRFCYKSNTNATPTNMSLATYRRVLDDIGGNLDQVALGLTGIQTNPDLIAILQETRDRGIVPNFTLSGADLTDEIAEKVVSYVGAIAVSIYEEDKELGYRTIRKFQSLGLEQVNMHLMVSKETLPFVREVVEDISNGVINPNAVVFLAVKPKGRAKNKFNPLSQDEFDDLMEYCMDKGIRFGMDSCSSIKFYRYLHSTTRFTEEHKKQILQLVEPCESGLFSIYVNVEGKVFPCSFCEGEGEWKEGMDTKDVWFNSRFVGWRNYLVNNTEDGCRLCPMFPNINRR